MSNLGEYFSTDWAAMTTNDWVGVSLTVVVFLLILAAYIYALYPKNRETLEAQRFIPLDDEQFDGGEKHGG
ncbi:cbb3-type cytochrome c oxidase subunit 3 [Pseudomonadota bacterium]